MTGTGETERRGRVHQLMLAGQARMIAALEALEPSAAFGGRSWQRPGGGGGTARVLADGAVFERAGVNVSAVHGASVPPSLAAKHPAALGRPFYATGLSIVVHPLNPYAPSFHANYRYFESGDIAWFGGGADLTPHYLFEEDVAHFHHVLELQCRRHDLDYDGLRRACDDYFYIKHRGERRGVGGIFFDELPAGDADFEPALAFVADGIETLERAYAPLVERRHATPYGERERRWQLLRRGRYVEFNLVYDRGTLFGLQTSGDIEAILMSMPPTAQWAFDAAPEPGSPEERLLDVLRNRS